MKLQIRWILIALLALASAGCNQALFSKDASGSGDDPGGPSANATPSPIPTPVPGECPGEFVDPNSCLVAVCRGGIDNPRVEITWCQNPNANSNSLQKGDMHPADPQRFWDWLYQNPNDPAPFTVFSFTDHDVDAGQTYYYRAKFRPELPSNVSAVALPIDECTCREE